MDCRAFLEQYTVTDLEKDPLPIKVLRNSIIKEEIPGQAVHWGFDYLDQRSCPLTLINHILDKLHHEVMSTDFSQCAEPSTNTLDDSNPLELGTKYEPLKLMRAIVKILDDICMKEKEDCHDSVDGVMESPDMLPHVHAVSYNNIKNTRRFMEDRMTILPRMDRIFNLPVPISYFAVFDGHNGSEAAAYGAAQLHQYFIQSLTQHEDVIPSINDAFEALDEVFVQKCRNGKIKSGSTVVLSLIMSNKLYVAWVGDSQAVLVKHNETTNLVTPHKPERKDEHERIKSVGGEVFPMNGTYRVNGNLAVSRAIGDADDKVYIISTPDIKMLELDGTEEFLILACDGLWDEVSPETAAQIVRRQVVADSSNISSISQSLISQAKQSGSTDNISVIVVFLEAPESIKNRYEGVLLSEQSNEHELVAMKPTPEPLDLKPDFMAERNNESPVDLEININGHGKDMEPLVDYLSFGSSRESAAQLISDDTGNNSGEDDIDKKDEVEVLSDAESDDDEWQFKKPSNENVTITDIITDGATNEMTFGLNAVTLEDNVTKMQVNEDDVTILKVAETESSIASFNPFTSESVAGFPSEVKAEFVQLHGDSIFEACNEPLSNDKNLTGTEQVEENDVGVNEAAGITNQIFTPDEPLFEISSDPVPIVETILAPSKDVMLESASASELLIPEPDALNPFSGGEESNLFGNENLTEKTEIGQNLATEIEANLNLGDDVSPPGNADPFDMLDQPVGDFGMQVKEEPNQECDKYDPFGERPLSGGIPPSRTLMLEEDLEYFAQVETNPIPEGLMEDPVIVDQDEEVSKPKEMLGSEIGFNPFTHEVMEPGLPVPSEESEDQIRTVAPGVEQKEINALGSAEKPFSVDIIGESEEESQLVIPPTDGLLLPESSVLPVAEAAPEVFEEKQNLALSPAPVQEEDLGAGGEMINLMEEKTVLLPSGLELMEDITLETGAIPVSSAGQEGKDFQTHQEEEAVVEHELLKIETTDLYFEQTEQNQVTALICQSNDKIHLDVPNDVPTREVDNAEPTSKDDRIENLVETVVELELKETEPEALPKEDILPENTAIEPKVIEETCTKEEAGELQILPEDPVNILEEEPVQDVNTKEDEVKDMDNVEIKSSLPDPFDTNRNVVTSTETIEVAKFAENLDIKTEKEESHVVIAEPMVNGSTPLDTPSPVDHMINAYSAPPVEVVEDVDVDVEPKLEEGSATSLNPQPGMEASSPVVTAELPKPKKIESKSTLTKGTKSPTKPDALGGKVTRASPTSLASRKSPVKSVVDVQAKVAKGSSVAAKAPPSKATATPPKPLSKVGATAPAKPIPSRVTPPTHRLNASKSTTATSSETKAPLSKPPVGPTLKGRPATAPAPSKLGITKLAPTSTVPKRPTPTTTSTGVSNARPTANRAAGAAAPKPDVKSASALSTAAKPRPRNALAPGKPASSLVSKPEVKKPAVTKSATTTANAPKPGLPRQTAPKTAPTSSRTTAPKPTSGTSKLSQPAKPAPKASSNSATAAPRTAARAPTSASRAPTVPGVKKSDPLKAKKPASSGAVPKPLKSKPTGGDQQTIIKENGVNTKETEVVDLNQINGNHPMENETDKKDPIKENGVNNEHNGGHMVESMEQDDLLG